MSGVSNERCEEVHSVDPRCSDCQQIDKRPDWPPIKRAHRSSVPNCVRTDGLEVEQGGKAIAKRSASRGPLSVSQNGGLMSPTNVTLTALQLETFVSIFVKLNPHSIGIFQPYLPGIVGTQFLLANFKTMLLNPSDHAVYIIHLKSQMVDIPDFSGITLEDFDEGVVPNFDVVTA
jgi:hypothetical protein